MINIKDNIRLSPPPMSPEKKDVNICKQIFDIKWPIKLAGITIRKYFEINFIILRLRFGTVFFIILIFSAVIVLIDRKNDNIIEFIPTSGVKTTRLRNSTIEPII